MEHATHELGRIAVHHVSYLWLVPALPLLGAFVNAAVGLAIVLAIFQNFKTIDVRSADLMRE